MKVEDIVSPTAMALATAIDACGFSDEFIKGMGEYATIEMSSVMAIQVAADLFKNRNRHDMFMGTLAALVREILNEKDPERKASLQAIIGFIHAGIVGSNAMAKAAISAAKLD